MPEYPLSHMVIWMMADPSKGGGVGVYDDRNLPPLFTLKKNLVLFLTYPYPILILSV